MAKRDRREAAPGLSHHVLLAGFALSGKTSAGRALARLLGRRFLDTDALVRKASGLSPSEFIARRGLAAFRKAETAALEGLSALPAPAVIALGGGVLPVGARGRLLRKLGVTVFLDCPEAELARRLEAARGRPLLEAKTPGARRGKLSALLKRRLPFYRRADVMVRTAGLSPLGTAKRTAGELKRWALP